MRGRRVNLAVVLLGSLLAGCAARSDVAGKTGVRAYFDGDLAAARDVLLPLANRTDESYVLNNLRLGSTALLALDLPRAEGAFYRAVEVINAGGVNDPAREFSAYALYEGLKVWKGEPYERAMASYYLGLSYYLRGDYGNARASFENCLFKLADYGENPDDASQFRMVESDFALAHVMLGRTWTKLGRDDMAQRAFARALRTRADLAPLCELELHRRSNLLLLVDYDYGPLKVASDTGQVVGFVPSPGQAGPIGRPRVRVNGREIQRKELLVPTVDLVALAERREWRSIDTTRAIKDVVGKGLVVGGAIATGYGLANDSKEAAIGGLAAMALGALLSASAKADLRQWEMLPRTVFVVPLELPPGRYTVTVDAPPRGRTRLPIDQTWVDVLVPAQGETALYLRLLPWQRGPWRWPTREPVAPMTSDGPPPRDDAAPVAARASNPRRARLVDYDPVDETGLP